MQDDVITAAKWLGASLVFASLILVGGLHWILSSQVGRLTESMRAHREVSATVSHERMPSANSGRRPIRPNPVEGDAVAHGDPAPPTNSPTLSTRVEHLLTESEKLRHAGDDWERSWLQNQPTHLAPSRTHGGVGP